MDRSELEKRIRNQAKNELEHRRRARRNLIDFATYIKPDYQVNWHHALIADICDRIVSGQTKRAMIFSPPRSGKSQIVSRFLPAFAFGLNQDENIIAASHTMNLACEMSRDVKNIMLSPAYKTLFGDILPSRLKRGGKHIDRTDRFTLESGTGGYKAAAVGTAIAGFGFSLGVIDDIAKNRADANSVTIQERNMHWYASDFKTRCAPNARMLLMGTRWAINDLFGKLRTLESQDEDAEKWELITLPSVSGRDVEMIDADPRKGQEDIALWPQRYDLDVLAQFRSVMGIPDFCALYQQQPIPPGGALFKESWFREFREDQSTYLVDGLVHYKNQCQYFMCVDPAASENSTADYTAIGIFCLTPNNDLLILEIFRERLGVEGIVPKMLQMCRKWKTEIAVFESNGFQKAISREAMRTVGMCPIHEVVANRAKAVRAEAAIIRMASGQIYFPVRNSENTDLDWIPGFKTRLLQFSGIGDERDDEVDVLAYAALKQQDMSRVLKPTGTVPNPMIKELQNAGYELPATSVFGIRYMPERKRII